MAVAQSCPQRSVHDAFLCWCTTGCPVCLAYARLVEPDFPAVKRAPLLLRTTCVAALASAVWLVGMVAFTAWWWFG